MFILLLSFRESLATEHVSLSMEPCMARPTLIDLNPIEPYNYLFMNSLDKSSESCNAADNLSSKICV